MLLAYVDESGNTGAINRGGSVTYTLGCVLVSAERWPSSFDQMLAFRRRLRDRFKIPMRAELRSSDLVRGGGDFRPLNLAPGERHLVFRSQLRALSQFDVRAFAIVVDKRTQASDACFDLAWEGLLQRLERTSSVEKQPFMLLHDEGEDERIRAWARRSRRHLPAGSAYGSSTIRRRASLLIEDPSPRSSKHSYFIQAADLVAYSAFRAVVPPSQAVATVCPGAMWDEIGSATHTAVSGLRPRSKPGIVLR